MCHLQDPRNTVINQPWLVFQDGIDKQQQLKRISTMIKVCQDALGAG